MAQPAVRVEGLRELRRALRSLPPEFKRELAAIHKAAAEPVAETAAQLAPVQTGRLQKSIRAAGTQKAGQARAGGARVPYAGPVHYGWPNRRIVYGKATAGPAPIPANEFLNRALAMRERLVIDVFEERTDRLITKVWRATGNR